MGSEATSGKDRPRLRIPPLPADPPKAYTSESALEYASYSSDQQIAVHWFNERRRLEDDIAKRDGDISELRGKVDELNREIIDNGISAGVTSKVLGEYQSYRIFCVLFGFAAVLGGVLTAFNPPEGNKFNAFYVGGVCLTLFSGVASSLGSFAVTFAERAFKRFFGLKPRR